MPLQTVENLCEKQWFAMRATYSQELSSQKILNSLSIESFIPMIYKITTKGGKKVKKLVPALGNYIFVHGSEEQIHLAKQKISCLRYVMSHSKAKVVVPTTQMENFIRVASANDNSAIYFTPEELKFKKGDKIRIHGGPFNGAEGELIKLEGKRNKRLLVQIDNLLALTVITNPQLIELL